MEKINLSTSTSSTVSMVKINSSKSRKGKKQEQQESNFEEFNPNADLLAETASFKSMGPNERNSSTTNNNNPSQKWLFTIVMLLLGGAASAAFLAVGILGTKTEDRERFQHEAEEFIYGVRTAWGDYELFGLWIHQSCFKSFRRDMSVDIKDSVEQHLGFCSRHEFRNLYEYIVSDPRVQFQAIEFVPKVFSDEREELERQSALYYQEFHPEVEYKGITQANISLDGERTMIPRAQEDFYWPVHLVEPIANNEEALDMDSYAPDTQRESIKKAIKTFKPVLSDRTRLVQESEPDVYGLILQHPGVPTSLFEDEPIALSQIVIRVTDLFRRAIGGVVVKKSVYLHDSTESKTDPQFLGAARVQQGPNASTLLTNLPETSLANIPRPNNSFQSEIAVADRTWIVTVVSGQGKPQLAFVLLGGCAMFFASVILVVWFHTHMARVAKLNQLRSEGEAEKSKHARMQVARERHMNEFLSHEVRNPLSSAISALSFVSATVNDPTECTVLNETTKQTLKYDLGVMDASLQFINELLRNMLDIHRSASKQIKIDSKPADILRDILDPVASILFMRRGDNVDVQVDCQPQNLVVATDRMRLKQIVLNLAANSTKFVTRGYIRLRTRILPDDGTVEVSIEDSGPGIPTEKRNRLFAKFQESLDSLNQGTGIGLAVCKNLCDLMGADIWLDEEFQSGVEGCPGARFVIRLNQKGMVEEEEEEPTEQQERTALLETDGSSRRAIKNGSGAVATTNSESKEESAMNALPEDLSILFVDDDTVLRKMFNRSLKRVAPQWSVQEASNGETALRLVETQQFDIIFMDQYMASIEKQLLGTETVLAMRSRGVDCIICGLSANDMETQFLEAGANAFMFKPFRCEKETLSLEILRLLETRNTASPPPIQMV